MAKLQLLHRTSVRETKFDYRTNIIWCFKIRQEVCSFKLTCSYHEYYIYKCKWKNTSLSFKAFKENVKYELKLEKKGEKLDKNHLPFKWGGKS